MSLALAADAFCASTVEATRPARTGPAIAYLRMSRRVTALGRSRLFGSDDTALSLARVLQVRLRLPARRRGVLRSRRSAWQRRRHLARGERRRLVDHPGLHVLGMRVEIPAARAA